MLVVISLVRRHSPRTLCEWRRGDFDDERRQLIRVRLDRD